MRMRLGSLQIEVRDILLGIVVTVMISHHTCRGFLYNQIGLKRIGSFFSRRLSSSSSELAKSGNSNNENNVRRISPYKTLMPTPSHIVLDKKDIKERVIVVGDVHGCFDELKELLMECRFQESTSTVIFVGDLVNKGPYSSQVIKYVRELCESKVGYAVRGNHDDWVIAISQNLLEAKKDKYQYMEELSTADKEWFCGLPYTISIPSLDSLIVHAGLVPNVALEDQLPGDLHSMRNIEESIVNGQTVYTATSKNTIGRPWVEYWKSLPHVYFGHDAQRGLQRTEFATGLDTGCCYGKQLTAVILPDREFVSVKAKQVYEPIKE